MKYKDVKKEDARKCCKKHHYKDKKGKIYSDCDNCPLRRSRIDKNGKEHTLFCWYVIYKMYEDVDEEVKTLNEEEIQYNKEWEKWVEENIKTEL